MRDPISIRALADEVANGNFSDDRLNKRLHGVVEGLATNPAATLPCLFDGAGLEGVYRFYSNQRVTSDDILKAHVEATRLRCEQSGDFLVLHDSTSFLYRWDGEREGLGRVTRKGLRSKQAFFAHASLAVSADGTRRPLGVPALTTWIRTSDQPAGTEYQRWEAQARLSATRLDGLASAIHVMDREADDYQMFHAFIRDEHRFVVRCQHNRWLETATGNDRLHALFDRLPGTIEREVPCSRRKPKRDPKRDKINPPRDARIAKLSIAAERVSLKKPASKRQFNTHPPKRLPINMVRVWEPDPPPGEEAVEWFLYTSEPIDTPEQQAAVVDHYRARWTIEEFFKALKTGCKFESRQLQDYESLVNLLTTFAIIAYRLLLIRTEARRASDCKAETVLSCDHIDVLRARGRLKLSASPTNQEVHLAIAALGGHIKYNGDPGWLTLTRGLEKLDTLTEGWVAAKLQLRSDQ